MMASHQGHRLPSLSAFVTLCDSVLGVSIPDKDTSRKEGLILDHNLKARQSQDEDGSVKQRAKFHPQLGDKEKSMVLISFLAPFNSV